jgi:hypothetical protein
LGNILAQTRDVQAALESYEAAKEYGYESELMIRRIDEFNKLAKKAERKGKFMHFVKNNYKTIFWLGLTGIVLVSILMLRFIKRRKKRKGNTDLD